MLFRVSFLLLTLLAYLPGASYGQAAKPSLALPVLVARPGAHLVIPVIASADRAYGADLAFVTDSRYLIADSDLVAANAFGNDADLDWNVVGDTVYVSLAPPGPLQLENQPLVRLSFTLAADAPTGARIPLAWLKFDTTNVDEAAPALSDGLIVVVPPGDVSADGVLTSFDASLTLQYVVGTRPHIAESVADVTGNGMVTSFDAALVLRRIIDPDYRLPVESGLSGPKAGRAPSCALRWRQSAEGWLLVAEGEAPVLSATLTLEINSGAAVRVRADALMASRWRGNTLRVAFARYRDEGDVLFRIENSRAMPPPRVLAASVNESDRLTWSQERPTGLLLYQNAPNPFNPTTTISFRTSRSGNVRVNVYALSGRFVRTLVNERLPAGYHAVAWDGRDEQARRAASGAYLYRLLTREGTRERVMILAR